jgi:exo-beta-1,3-glucanase (GH17 family)
MVRIYDITCNQVALVTVQAAKRNMQVIAGFGNPINPVPNVYAIVSQAGSNLDVIDTIAIGNEYINENGADAVPAVTAALATARTALAGVFSGHIVTIDTFNALISNPALCAASDYCAANCHAFFDSSTDAAGAGGFVQSQVANITAANPDKTVVITESGWAWADHSRNPNPKASEDQQVAAIASLKGVFSSNLFLFQGFDTLYKGDNYEGYFGMYSHDDM